MPDINREGMHVKGLKVLHVIDSLMVGGAERVLVDQVNLLNSHGWDVSVLILGDQYPLRKELNPAVSFFSLDQNTKFSWKGVRTVLSLCQRTDIVHVHLRYNFRYIAILRLLFFGRFRVIHQDHFGDIDGFRHVPFLLKFLSQLNPWFIGVSRNLTEWAIKELSLPKSKVFLLSNIVRIQDASNLNLVENSNDRSLRFLMVANFREAKNHSFLLKLIPALSEKFDKVEVHLFGQVLSDSFFEDLKKQIDNLGIGRIVWLHTDCQNVQPLLKSFDLGIHPAFRESGPLVLIEYLGYGLPFIANTTGQVAEQLNHDLPDFFLNSFEPSLWLKRIEFLLKHRNELQIKMRDCFLKYYSENSYIKELEGFYRIVLEN